MIRVLYVDDEPDLSEIAVMALELDADFDVRNCSSGEAALDTLRDWRADIVLLDVMMPGMGGIETSRALRRDPATADIPFAFVTARRQARDIEELMAEGALAVIGKPFDPTTLAQTVRGLVESG